MEFHITMPAAISDIGAIEDTLHAVDPAASMDVDATGHALRISTSLDTAGVLSLLGRSGHAVAPGQVTQVASTCCGSCSG